MSQSSGKSVDLVLEGGGVKGIALLGAVLELYEAGYRFARVAGTSAGAIIGALIVGYQRAGRDLGELYKVMQDLDYAKFEDGNVPQQICGHIGDGTVLMLHDGAHTGDYLLDWLTPLLADVGVRTFADLRLPDDPDTSLPEHQQYALVVHASDLTRQALVRLPWDYAEYGLAPDTQSVVDAVRASMSVPFFFRPVTVKTQRGQATWVDGGLLSNFPITAFDRTDGRPGRWPTWGIKFSKHAVLQSDEPVHHPAQIALACLRTAISDDINQYQHSHDGISRSVISVDTTGIDAMNFRLGQDDKNKLYDDGRAAAARFLDNLGPAVTAGIA